MGAYEVAANGDFANWKLKGTKGGGIGGAMDLAASAKRVYIMLEHRTRDGASRLLPRCSLPITAAGVVTLVVTDLGLFAPSGEGFALRDLAPGVTLEEVRAATACPIIA
jgi:3-oxoacid CoA-transferase B subunit